VVFSMFLICFVFGKMLIRACVTVLCYCIVLLYCVTVFGKMLIRACVTVLCYCIVLLYLVRCSLELVLLYC
jgi:hypothetical protein